MSAKLVFGVLTLSVAGSAWAADLEVGDPTARVMVQPLPFPHQQPIGGKMMRFINAAAVETALRDKVAKLSQRPVLILVAPDSSPNPYQDFRVIWLGNLMMSGDERTQRALALMDVTVAPLATVRRFIPTAEANAVAYLVGLRDGKPFAFTLSAVNATEEQFHTALADRAFKGADFNARAAKVRDELAADDRKRVEQAFADMADDSFDKREAASKAVAAHMPGVAPWVHVMMEKATDMEVRVRCSALLADAGKSWRKNGPAGCSWMDANGGMHFKEVGQLQMRRNVVLQVAPQAVQIAPAVEAVEVAPAQVAPAVKPQAVPAPALKREAVDVGPREPRIPADAAAPAIPAPAIKVPARAVNLRAIVNEVKVVPVAPAIAPVAPVEIKAQPLNRAVPAVRRAEAPAP